MLQCLTPRERDVAQLICTGASNKQIARALAVSEGTIKMHLHCIYDKLAIPNRTMLALTWATLPTAMPAESLFNAWAAPPADKAPAS
jgi:DNA-binding NarL/FixJ family response regulator